MVLLRMCDFFSGVAGTTRKHKSSGFPPQRGPVGPPGPPGNNLTVYNEMNETTSLEKRYVEVYTVLSL